MTARAVVAAGGKKMKRTGEKWVGGRGKKRHEFVVHYTFEVLSVVVGMGLSYMHRRQAKYKWSGALLRLTLSPFFFGIQPFFGIETRDGN